MSIRQVIQSQSVPVKIWTDDADERSKQQLKNIASPSIKRRHKIAKFDNDKHSEARLFAVELLAS